MATNIVDEYLDSSENNDDLFPCKGCGEILEEGKAFELAGNRWHLDCFRCNTCGTLLDSDANLLLLGDGSLICNNCTYSCTACGNKIEDLAILTGDQAFCSTCFRCRNCKRKIENLRYARTSQGIFCMQCHETLMARRRKKTKAAAAAKAREKEQSSTVEKSLPALPPNVVPNNAFSNDRVDPEGETPTEHSSRHRQSQLMADARPDSRTSEFTARSPKTEPQTEGLNLPSQAYKPNRNSAMVSEATSRDSTGDGFFIPVALDPSPGPTAGTVRSADDPNKRKDYFSGPTAEKRPDSHAPSTPHIAFQSKGRTQSSEQQARLPQSKFDKSSTEISKSASSPAAVDGRSPKPQDLERTRISSSQSATSPDILAKNGATFQNQLGGERKTSDSGLSPRRTSNDLRRPGDEKPRASLDSRRPDPLSSQKPIARKELPTSATRSTPPQHIAGAASPGARHSGPEQGATGDSYMVPRSAPAPPQQQQQQPQDNNHLQPKSSPKLPRWSSGGDFSLDEDMARILGTDEQASHLMRRVSNAVRHGRTGSIEGSGMPHRAGHGRSVSETTHATAESPKWAKSPLDAANEGIAGSPLSGVSIDDPTLLRKQLRNSENRVAELERQFNTETDLKNLNKRLIEKRKTVSVLDTQTEILIQQLEVLTKYVERAKETKAPIDPKELEDSAIREFLIKLDKVKIALSAGIEQLHEERDQLLEEKEKAMSDRDRALMEFEQLSSKNAQLADMNNDLTHQLQGRYKNMGGDMKPSSNGLGIYGQAKATAGAAAAIDASSINTGPTLVGDDDSVIEQGPRVVEVKKGQVKKFNWKKGSKTMAQNISKGMNKAALAFQQEREHRPGGPPGGMAVGDIGMPYNTTVAAVEGPATPGSAQARAQAESRQGFGFFGKKANTMPMPMPKSASAANMVADVPEPPNVLFGSDLVARAEFEKRQIPSIVSRCIEEVELRGMDQEGIYRKTGGNSQVNTIKDGLDRDENFDLSDPDLDITAVTSVLKQYFRKLPIPLLTFDVYDRVLESTSVPDAAERCDHLRKTFATLPPQHRAVLEFLMFHLDRVAHREGENLMPPKNLAVVFAPTIMRDLSIEREMSDMHAKNLAVQFVIENTHTIFNDA